MNPPAQAVLDKLKAHEAELRCLGVQSLSVFGSIARGEAATGSDVDVVVRLGAEFSHGGFDHFGKLENLRRRLSSIVGREVDLIEEPVRKERLRREIEAERVLAF